MSQTARKSLFITLQAGRVAHLSLRERAAAEIPWVKVRGDATSKTKMKKHSYVVLRNLSITVQVVRVDTAEKEEELR